MPASLIGNVTIQCAIGHDGTVSASAGTPAYVDAGYVDTGYQVYTGQTAAPFADVSYSIPVLQPGGLVYPLTKDQVFVSETVTYEDELVNVGTERVHQSAELRRHPGGRRYHPDIQELSGAELALRGQVGDGQ